MAIKIIGTSHISKQSIKDIIDEVSANRPDIIALELDVRRTIALTSKDPKNKINLKQIKLIGFKGFIFAKVGQYFQEKMGQMVGIKPGSEMKKALLLAHKEKIAVALIDQPIEITLRNFSKTLTWKEKFNFVKDFFKGIFQREKQIQELGLENLDLSKVPEEELIEKLLSQLNKNYPNIYKSLVSDRNRFMSKALLKLQRNNPNKNILAIVGAGHKKEMNRIIAKNWHKLNLPENVPEHEKIKPEDLV
ncbi:hypothetical protein HN385_05875 [archaeon]|jgi:pheromone shutdown-related protein TraB|nr:hypothetical protein [archaeon]MBT3451112.1 hypothetical protein [archaeon]MBT6868644.1 hypothetical protein [archaeon]MBT7193389.1 hypothetical protein [archaeon]MBT7381441.1 hypothetical protein [archaeon]